jgi:hypothetical protein
MLEQATNLWVHRKILAIDSENLQEPWKESPYWDLTLNLFECSKPQKEAI